MPHIVTVKVHFRTPIPTRSSLDPEAPTHACTVVHNGEPQGFARKWRWKCSCGAKGRWQGQSDHASVFAWFRHARKALGFVALRRDPQAYAWLAEETAPKTQTTDQGATPT